MKEFIKKCLEEEYQISKSLQYKAEDWVTEEWEAIKHIEDFDQQKESGLPLERLKDVGEKITNLPQDAEFHRLVRRIFDARYKSI